MLLFYSSPMYDIILALDRRYVEHAKQICTFFQSLFRAPEVSGFPASEFRVSAVLLAQTKNVQHWDIFSVT
jgi:hypothetical protein